ncbi:MAG: hypothetical protein GXY44_00125 [Phycisphaerales bacterium]|nr:hypothetical protein [Phycisphaerales bacterium]
MRNEMIKGYLPLYLLTGLFASISGCLNPLFVNNASGGLYALAPGSDEPFLLVRAINDTQATLNIPIVFDDGMTSINQVLTRPINELSPEMKELGVLLPWPVIKLGIGSLDDRPEFSLSPSIVAVFPDGNTIGVPFGYESLKEGLDFNKGDAIIFHFVADAQNIHFITLSIGRIDGATQTESFSRGDTFETIRQTLLFNQMYEYLPNVRSRGF